MAKDSKETIELYEAFVWIKREENNKINTKDLAVSTQTNAGTTKMDDLGLKIKKLRLAHAKRALSLSSSQVAETTRTLRSLTQDVQTMNRELQELKERKKRIAEILKNKEKERAKYYGRITTSI